MFGPILVASVPRSPLCLDSLVSHLGQVLNSVPLPHPPDPPPCLPAHSASLSSGFCGGDAGCCPCSLWSSLGARPVLARSCLVLARCLWPSSFLRSIFSPLSDSHDSCARSFHPARALADPAGLLSPEQTPDWLSRPAHPAPRPPHLLSWFSFPSSCFGKACPLSLGLGHPWPWRCPRSCPVVLLCCFSSSTPLSLGPRD